MVVVVVVVVVVADVADWLVVGIVMATSNVISAQVSTLSRAHP